jgi:hypothetical protein
MSETDSSDKAVIGIYFLWLGEECVYIGQSRDVLNRVKKHRTAYEFDRFSVMKCDEWDLNAFETKLIASIKPKHNKKVAPGMDFPDIPKPRAIVPNIRARMATARELLDTVVPAYLTPIPSERALVTWFKRFGVTGLKANPSAIRGGGKTWWHVADVEKMLREKAGLLGAYHKSIFTP